MVTDDGGLLTYVRHGTLDDPTSWRTLGPFAYTERALADAAITGGKLTPQGDDSRLFIREVGVEWFAGEFFEGFHTPTDAFMVDEAPLPMTEAGAEWIDRTNDDQLCWLEQFQTDDLGWMQAVVRRLGLQLGMTEQQLDDMGALIMARQDAEDEFAKVRQLVQDHIKVSIVPEDTAKVEHQGDVHVVDAKNGTFWLHTNGMAQFDLPELEIREVPAWWVTAAGAEINGWAGYFIANPDEAKPGAELQGGGPLQMSLSAKVSPDDWWNKEGRACLRLEAKQVFFAYEGHGHLIH